MTETFSTTRQYLEMVAGQMPRSFERFVLQHGEEHQPHTTKCLHRGKMKECFMNAYRLVDRSNGALWYCEGFAWSIIPVLHAWAVDKDGNVFEPTWRDIGISYFGIAFKMEFVRDTILRRGRYGVIDDMENRFELITKTPPVSQWKETLKPCRPQS